MEGPLFGTGCRALDTTIAADPQLWPENGRKGGQRHFLDWLQFDTELFRCVLFELGSNFVPIHILHTSVSGVLHFDVSMRIDTVTFRYVVSYCCLFQCVGNGMLELVRRKTHTPLAIIRSIAFGCRPVVALCGSCSLGTSPVSTIFATTRSTSHCWPTRIVANAFIIHVLLKSDSIEAPEILIISLWLSRWSAAIHWRYSHQ